MEGVRVGLYRPEVEGIGCLWEMSKFERLCWELMHPQRRGFRELMHLYKLGECYHPSVKVHSNYGDRDSIPDMYD